MCVLCVVRVVRCVCVVLVCVVWVAWCRPTVIVLYALAHVKETIGGPGGPERQEQPSAEKDGGSIDHSGRKAGSVGREQEQEAPHYIGSIAIQ